MNDKMIAIVILIGMCIIGVGKIIVKLFNYNNRRNFTIEYLNNYRKYINNMSDGNSYVWLTSNVAKIQYELGENGVAYNCKLPFSNFMYKECKRFITPRILTNI